MKKKLLLQLLSLALLACPCGASQAQETSSAAPARLDHIIWLKADASRINPTLKFIARKLPKIRHEYLSTNSIRSWQMIQRGEPVCRPPHRTHRSARGRGLFC